MTKSNYHNGNQTKFITLYIETEENGLERTLMLKHEDIQSIDIKMKDTRDRTFDETVVITMRDGKEWIIVHEGHFEPKTNIMVGFQEEFEWAAVDPGVHIHVKMIV